VLVNDMTITPTILFSSRTCKITRVSPQYQTILIHRTNIQYHFKDVDIFSFYFQSCHSYLSGLRKILSWVINTKRTWVKIIQSEPNWTQVR